jgi:chaperonin GroES
MKFMEPYLSFSFAIAKENVEDRKALRATSRLYRHAAAGMKFTCGALRFLTHGGPANTSSLISTRHGWLLTTPLPGIGFSDGEVSMKFRPLHDRVVVRRLEGEEKTKGGIIIPDTAKEKPQEGEIIAVGSGARDESGKLVPLDVKAGDRILFGKWSGTEVKIDGEDLLIMKESDIMGVLEGSSIARKKAA